MSIICQRMTILLSVSIDMIVKTFSYHLIPNISISEHIWYCYKVINHPAKYRRRSNFETGGVCMVDPSGPRPIKETLALGVGIATVIEKELCIPFLMQLDQLWLCLISVMLSIYHYSTLDKEMLLSRMLETFNYQNYKDRVIENQGYMDRVIEKLGLVSRWPDWLAIVMSQ